MGGIEKELPNEVKTFVIGNMCSRFLSQRFAIEVLDISVLLDNMGNKDIHDSRT